jgi:hypothetical protein
MGEVVRLPQKAPDRIDDLIDAIFAAVERGRDADAVVSTIVQSWEPSLTESEINAAFLMAHRIVGVLHRMTIDGMCSNGGSAA